MLPRGPDLGLPGSIHAATPARPQWPAGRAAGPRRQRVRLDRRRSRRRSRCSTPSSTPASTWSTPPTSIRAGSGPQRRRIGGVIGRWLKKSGKRDRVVLATKVGMEMGDGKIGLARDIHPRGGRRFAAPAADRPHRPVPVARRRPEDAARRNARRLCRADPRRQGARDRRVSNYSRRAARRGARDQRAARPAALRNAAAAVQPDGARGVRGRARAAVPARGPGRRSTTSRWRAAFSPASTAARPSRQERARRRHRQEVPERAWPARARRARQRGRAAQGARRRRSHWPGRWRGPGITAPIASATSRRRSSKNWPARRG